MIIREQSDETYNFIGDCFVLGVMDGEVMGMDEYRIHEITIS